MTSLADVILSDEETIGNLDATRTALREAVTSTASEQASTEGTGATDSAATATTDENVPEKFRGKSAKDLVDMYQNLESRLGSMANDLGVQRQLTDRLLGLKREADLRQNTPPPERKTIPVTANDILDRPQETLDRVVEARVSTVTEDVNARLNRAEAQLAQTAFTLHHPDYQTVVNDPTFGEWVKGSAIRMRAAAAANQGNWQIADELLTDFKAGQSTRTSAASKDEGGKVAPKADLEGARRASLETTGSAGGKQDGRSGGGKKTYRRADLMLLRINDPEAYYDPGFQDEILNAHHEGRVR